MSAITLNLQSTISLTDEQFASICRHNRDLRFERTATGDLIIMSPTGGDTGRRNSNINAQLWLWNQQAKLGEVFDSSTGFILPNGATRSPDAAWIQQAKWNNLTTQQQQQFIPLCPDFVIELRSNSDVLGELQNKMEEYLSNGLSLGWLIDPQNQQVAIYRSNSPVEIITNPETISAENILPGFVLKLEGILN